MPDTAAKPKHIVVEEHTFKAVKTLSRLHRTRLRDIVDAGVKALAAKSPDEQSALIRDEAALAEGEAA